VTILSQGNPQVNPPDNTDLWDILVAGRLFPYVRLDVGDASSTSFVGASNPLPTSVADGADVALGAKADDTYNTGVNPGSAISLLKGSLQNLANIEGLLDSGILVEDDRVPSTQDSQNWSQQLTGPAGFVVDESPAPLAQLPPLAYTINENSVGAARIDPKRAVIVSLEDAVNRGVRMRVQGDGSIPVAIVPSGGPTGLLGTVIAQASPEAPLDVRVAAGAKVEVTDAVGTRFQAAPTGGFPVGVADGADVAFGSRADVAWDGGAASATEIAIDKAMFARMAAILDTVIGSKNDAIYSQDYGNAAWTRTNCTFSGSGITAPDGTPSATGIASNAGGPLLATLNQVVAMSASTPQAGANYFQKGKSEWVGLRLSDLGGASHDTWFNLALGTIGTTDGSVIPLITYAGGGWYKCEVRLASSNTGVGNPSIAFFPADANGNTQSTGDGVVPNIYAWGSHFRKDFYKTGPYVRTLGTPAVLAARITSGDGDQFSLGATSDSGWSGAGNGTAISVLKGIYGKFVGGVVLNTQLTDLHAFTENAQNLDMVGFIYDEVAGATPAEDTAEAARVDIKRSQVVVLEDATTRGRRQTVDSTGAAKVAAVAEGTSADASVYGDATGTIVSQLRGANARLLGIEQALATLVEMQRAILVQNAALAAANGAIVPQSPYTS
jgi:hypothetical protein